MFESTTPKPPQSRPSTATTTTTTTSSSSSSSSSSSYGACAGNSSSLVSADCEAWQDLFDATGGSSSWIACQDLRLDPCACLTNQGQVVCGGDGSHLTAINLQANGLTGSLPASLAAMTELTLLNVVR